MRTGFRLAATVLAASGMLWGTLTLPVRAGTQPAAQPPAGQPAAGAQPAPGDLMDTTADLPPARPAISLLLNSEPLITVSYEGDFGQMRVTGRLVDTPDRPLKVVLSDGSEREIGWEDLFSLNVVRIPTTVLPVGTFTLALASQAGVLPRSTAVITVDYQAGTTTAPAIPIPPPRIAALPPGDLVLEGEPYRVMRIPTERITDLRMEPIRGSLVSLPEGELELQVTDPGAGNGRRGNRNDGKGGNGNGSARNGAREPKIVHVPVNQIETYRRDRNLELVSVSLSDAQVFTGRLVRPPTAVIEVEADFDGSGVKVVKVPVASIAQLETTLTLLNRGPDGLNIGP